MEMNNFLRKQIGGSKIHFPFRVLFLRALLLPRVQNLYVPSDTSSEDEDVLLRVDEKKPSLDTLNTYLAARDIIPVKSQLQTPWEKAR